MADDAFRSCSGDPAADLNVQLCKLGIGLHTDNYLKETRILALARELQNRFDVKGKKMRNISNDEAFISPFSFKTLVGRGHPEFSGSHQQDASEYLDHLFSVFQKYAG